MQEASAGGGEEREGRGRGGGHHCHHYHHHIIIMSFVGGKLRLKGGCDLSGITKKKKKKKKKSSSSSSRRVEAEAEERVGVASTGGYVITDEGPQDRRTDAEKRHEQRLQRREEEEIAKAAGKTHRERVKEFNEKLANMSEHYDIPKVGPG